LSKEHARLDSVIPESSMKKRTEVRNYIKMLIQAEKEA